MIGVEWIPLIITAFSIAGAVITYAIQKRVDRKSALVEIRRTAYRQYLDAFMDMTNSPELIPEIQRRRGQSELELLVVGSDSVVKAVGALSHFYAVTNHDRFNRDSAEVRRLLAEVCRAMRADCFEKSALSVEEIQTLIPIA